MIKTKICTNKYGCGLEKPIEEFVKSKRNKDGYTAMCLICKKICNKTYYNLNIKNILIQKHDYYIENREKILEEAKIYYKKNIEYILFNKKLFYINNKKIIIEKRKTYYDDKKIYISLYKKEYRLNNKTIINEKRKFQYINNIEYKLRQRVSSNIRRALIKNKSSKYGKSILKFLSYSMQELKQHLQNLFSHPDNLDKNNKVWMTWKNYGVYNATIWNDNDSTTYRWQIDHIIPQSDLPFTLMTDKNFKICWDLSNLRPYSAKQNILDGVRKVRHLTNNNLIKGKI